jgi:hypothetical protein
MATKTRNVRYPEWIQQAVLRFVEKNQCKDFSSAVVFLLECELNRRGYFRTDYEPGIVDFELTDDIKSPHERPSEKEKRLEFENKSKEAEIQRLKDTENPNSRFNCSEDRFFELLPYFPDKIRNEINNENLSWEQVKQKYNLQLLHLLDKAKQEAERQESTPKGTNPVHDKDKVDDKGEDPGIGPRLKTDGDTG